MSGIAFVTHPSVRIKGSENVYSPVQCVDDLCPIGPPHMHCPFCVKTESYTDPVILKAHYRVKHVDKGIEFAGLKILRCCEHCDIVGVIKGEKKFKGAHWHCYRCRNGFNRRDEAIKHYKTHFRNPQTTFQISITSDLNSPVPTYQQSQDPPRAQQPSSNIQTSQPDNTLPASHEIIHPALTEAVSCISSPVAVNEQDMGGSTVALTNGKVHDGAVHVSIEAACNSVDVTNDEEQAIIVIQEQQLDSAELDSSFAPMVNNEVSIVSEKEGQEKGVSMAERVQLLEQDKVVLKKEVQRLRKQVERLEDVVRTCKKREEELTARLGNASERGITETLQKMEAEHRNLLRQQLDTLHQTFMASRSPSSTVLQLTDHSGQEIQVVSAASLEAFLASTVNTTSTSEGHATLPTTTIIQAGDLTLEQVSGPSSSSSSSSNNSTAAVVTAGHPLTTASTDLGSGSYVMCVQSVKTEKEDHEQQQQEEVEEEEEEEEEGGKERVAGGVKPPVDETAKTEEPPAKKAKTK